MFFARALSASFLLLAGTVIPLCAYAQDSSQPSPETAPAPQNGAASAVEDTLPPLPLIKPSLEYSEEIKIPLVIPSGTPLRVALDRRVRIAQPGEVVHGQVVNAVYAFDQVVIPAGSVVTGRVVKVEPVKTKTRILDYANGNFSPYHGYQIEFDSVTLPDGKQITVATSVSPGTAEVVHLVANQQRKEAEKKKNAVTRTVEAGKQEVSDKVHAASAQIKTPGRFQRLKDAAIAHLPYHRQYLGIGTHFNATLEAPLSFGETTRTRAELADLGGTPPPDSLLHARLVAEVSSANATRGTAISAILTEPIFSPEHHLLLPANSRLVGEVVTAKPARKLHHNGDLRVAFGRVETPEGLTQAMRGSLEGVEVDRAAHLNLDEEGGAHATDSKTRYLSTGFAVLMAAAAARPDAEHGTTDAAGDPSVRAGAGISGFGFAGSLISLAAKSQPFSIALGAYGASQSIYVNFLSRGRDVVLPKDTPLEIGFGRPHTDHDENKN